MVAEPSNSGRMYRMLQVSPEASDQQIRRAYRRLAHATHPDIHPDDPEASRRFQEITDAYELLRSPERRARYDRGEPHADASAANASSNHEDVASAPTADRLDAWVVASRPTVIGTGSISLGSVPLVAGPVRVIPPNRRAAQIPTKGIELHLLIEAINQAWGRS